MSNSSEIAMSENKSSLYPLEGYVCWTDEIPIRKQILLIILVISATLWIVASNTVVIVASVTDAKLKEKNSSILVVNMALGDITIGLFVFPYHAFLDLVRYQFRAPCLMAFAYEHVDLIFNTVSLFTVLVLNVDRFIYIKYPLRYPIWMTRRKCYAMAACCWLVSIVASLAFIFVRPLNDNCISDIGKDYYEDTASLIIGFIIFSLPFLSVIVVSAILFFETVKVIKKDHRLRAAQNPDPELMHVTKRLIRAGVNIILINSLYVFMWGPLLTFMVLKTSCTYTYAAMYVLYINSGVNPLIWCLLREYRTAFFKLLRFKSNKRDGRITDVTFINGNSTFDSSVNNNRNQILSSSYN